MCEGLNVPGAPAPSIVTSKANRVKLTVYLFTGYSSQANFISTPVTELERAPNEQAKDSRSPAALTRDSPALLRGS